MTRRGGWLALGLGLLLPGGVGAMPVLAPTPAKPPVVGGAAQTPIFEEWSYVTLNGQRCGYSSTITRSIETPPGQRYQTLHSEVFVAKRDGAGVTISDESTVEEDAEGGVLSFFHRQKAGAEMVINGVRQGDEMIVHAQDQTARYPVPRLSVLGPEAIRRLTLKVPLQPGQTFSFRAFSPDTPQTPLIQSGTVVRQEDHAIGTSTRIRWLWRLSCTQSSLPGVPLTLWVDDEGNNVDSVANLPGLGELRQVVAPRADCMQQTEGAEIFATTLIHPDQPIADPASLAQATYRVTLGSNPAPAGGSVVASPFLGASSRQTVKALGGNAWEITVSNPPNALGEANWTLPHPVTPELRPFLASSAYLEVESPEIQVLAQQAVGGEKSPQRAAQKIEEFVRGYIVKKDLNIGFGSARETARSREGDCTEHAVLCAALGRAVGLPTRCVVGLGYIPPGQHASTITRVKGESNGLFGFHMWAEAWLGPGQWLPMDAALNGFDVGHIEIADTALNEISPLQELNGPILALLANLKIEVLHLTPKKALVD